MSYVGGSLADVCATVCDPTLGTMGQMSETAIDGIATARVAHWDDTETLVRCMQIGYLLIARCLQ